jgi:hypothetical protein
VPSPGMNRIEITGTVPPDIRVTVDGHPLACRSAVLTVDAENLPELSVTLPVCDGAVVTLDARLGLDGETRDALVAAGWTPPPEAP